MDDQINYYSIVYYNRLPSSQITTTFFNYMDYSTPLKPSRIDIFWEAYLKCNDIVGNALKNDFVSDTYVLDLMKGVLLINIWIAKHWNISILRPTVSLIFFLQKIAWFDLLLCEILSVHQKVKRVPEDIPKAKWVLFNCYTLFIFDKILISVPNIYFFSYAIYYEFKVCYRLFLY